MQSDEMRVISILLPAWMLTELREKAKRRGIDVVEHVRRCVALDNLLFDDPDATVTRSALRWV